MLLQGLIEESDPRSCDYYSTVQYSTAAMLCCTGLYGLIVYSNYCAYFASFSGENEYFPQGHGMRGSEYQNRLTRRKAWINSLHHGLPVYSTPLRTPQDQTKPMFTVLRRLDPAPEPE